MDFSPELDSEAIRVRLRRHMGEFKISRSALALASGINRSALKTKLDGPVEFTIPEIGAIAHALEKSWLWVITGQDIDLGGPGPAGPGYRAPVDPTRPSLYKSGALPLS